MATGKAANQTVKNQYDQIQAMTTSTGKEYGGEQNRAPLPAGGYMTPTVRTDSLTGSFLPNFTWNNQDGYTIGVAHGHPGRSAPSPADAVWAYGCWTICD